MTRMTDRTGWGSSCLGLAGVALTFALALSPAPVVAGPPPMGPGGMPDPSAMSGIPRPDVNLTPGTVTVRCLDGGFATPAIGIEVSLEITTAAGPVVRTAKTVDKGRATFAGLDEFLGSQVLARATIAGQELSSQSFTLGAQAGVALLLVKSAGPGAPAGPGAGGNPHGAPAASGADPHGGQGAVPVPGRPFPMAGRPPGTLIVGALDLGNAATAATPAGVGPIEGIEVLLEATAEGLAEPIREVVKTDAQGRATFVELDERLPPGAQIVIEVALEEGEPAQRSESFTLGETAYAVVFTRGQAQAQAEAPPPGPAPQQRMALPGPRVDKTLGPGQVRVVLLDAQDRPVPDQDVVIHSSQAAGNSSDRTGKTNAEGVAIIDDVPRAADLLAQLRVVYAGAPYSSTLFEMPEDTGAIVMLRVFRPTADRTRVRSALQIDVSPRENDFAAVSFNYAVFVDGDEAFWVPGGITMYGPVNTRSFHVMDEAKNWLLNDGEAPFAIIDRPLEPGVEIRLSFAVGVEHDGTLELDWSTPFPLVDEGSLVTVPAELAVTLGVGGAPEVNPHAGRDGEALEIYKLAYQPFETSLCDLLAEQDTRCVLDAWAGHRVAVVVEDLPVRTTLWANVAWILTTLTGLGVVGSMLLRRRVGPREALLARRDALMAELVALDALSGESRTREQGAKRSKLLRTLDRIYRQLEALESTT